MLKALTVENLQLKESVSTQTLEIEHYALLTKQLGAEIAKTKDDNERLSRERTDLEEKCMFKDR